jgi:hypothetical protein
LIQIRLDTYYTSILDHTFVMGDGIHL